MNTPAEPSRGSTVLVVDDDLAVRRLYATALQRGGFTTIEAEDGPSALGIVDAEPVGLLLIDQNMPGMTGMEVLERVRAQERTRTLPVIMVTGEGDVPSRIRGLDIGANDYVVKSTPLDELVARVRAQLRASVAWADLLGHELRARAHLVSELGSVSPADSPEATAGELVAKLAGVEGVTFVGLLHADPGGGLTPLAGWSANKGHWLGGGALAKGVSRHLLGRAANGPWAQTVGETPHRHTGRFVPAEIESVYGAPLRLADRVLGILVLGTPRAPTPLAPTGDLLAATIDYAAVASAVLGPGLEVRGRETSDRRRLERILAERAFHPVFQPLVGLSDGEVIGYEALTRFTDGVAPDLRFAEAARAGLRREFEEATLAEIMHAADALPAGAWLAINVSPDLVLLPGWLAERVRATSRRLVVDLTEHAPIDDYAALREILRALPSRVAVAVDDAGAGYASLRHIHELRPQFVKLDVSLVRGVDKDPIRQALVAGVAHFAEDTGSRLIAEGIETEAEASVMRRLGVRIGQGYLFGRPAEISALGLGADAETPAAERHPA